MKISLKILKHKKILAILLGILIFCATALLSLNFYFNLPNKMNHEDASLTWAQIPAFPNAQGFGTLTPGGRFNPLTGQNGTVIKVTNLNDAGPGSLREAINTKGPRIVVFEVSGIIELEEELAITEPFLTIAGQTSPGYGICLKNFGLTVMAPNVVVRFIRSRPGDEINENPENLDSIAIIGLPPQDTYNVVIDHCSLSWSQDETFSTWYSAHDITIQWSLIAEGLHEAHHPKKTHSMGVLLGDGGDNITVHHNLDAHHMWRNPLLMGGSIDYFNNLHYNFERGMEISYMHSDPVRLNAVGNSWIPGPNTTLDYMPTILVYEDISTEGEPKIYLHDNRGPKEGDISELVYDYSLIGPTWNYLHGVEQQNFITRYFVEELFDGRPNVTLHSALDAYLHVLQYVGASLDRDSVDLRIINDVKNKTGRIIDSPAEIGGWGIYHQDSVQLDSDDDGIPDSWELLNGLDPYDPDDNWVDHNGNGYVAIEEYINSLVSHLYPS
jgi:pectate lyase